VCNPIKIFAGLTIASLVFTASYALAGENESSIAPYNHVLKRSTLEVESGDEIQVREILFAPGCSVRGSD